PLTPEEASQGALELAWRLEQALIELTGLARVTLQPSAGAQGELAGILMVRAALAKSGNPRTTVLIPDSAHGTNPASAHFAGYKVRELKSNARGTLDLHVPFSTPHGGGGPGSGPVAVTEKLIPFLPRPTVERRPDGTFTLDHDRPDSIGRLRTFLGNYGMFVRALAYISAYGNRIGEVA